VVSFCSGLRDEYDPLGDQFGHAVPDSIAPTARRINPVRFPLPYADACS
jgi:hypothetical protein